jgi:ornithine cyclodeaminase
VTPDFITYETGFEQLSWKDALLALEAGHRRPKAEVADLFLGPATATLLNRAAYIDGFGYGVKAVTVTDGNPARGLPTTQGAMLLFDTAGGVLRAVIESRLITQVKTCADSLLGARLLARPESQRLLIVGAGSIAECLIAAYRALFTSLTQIEIWARREEQAQALVERAAGPGARLSVATDLARAAAGADIISCATLARTPILCGDWIQPGTHVDLIGAYKADMREADDALIARGSLYVDSRDTTLQHIGELKIPLEQGLIEQSDIRGDLYDLINAGQPGRSGDDDITVFKNGGGAHLDLMIADYIARTVATTQ